MNYIASYYKNLCEQLQEQINILEANIRSASEIEQLGHEEYKKALDRKEQQLGRKLTYGEVSDISDEILGPYIKRAVNRENLLARAARELPAAAQSGDFETVTQFADVMGDVSKRNISGKVAGFRNFSPESAERMQSYMQHSAELGKDVRNLGGKSTVPADIAAMRKVVAMGKGQYTPPFPTPETMHVTPSHY